MTVQETSLEAHRKAPKGENQLKIIDALQDKGPLADHELVIVTGLTVQSICGARNRLKELGWVRATKERRRTKNDLPAIVWELIPEGERVQLDLLSGV